MADGRMLKKTIANSKKLSVVSDRAKVVWFMMLPHTDIDGRVKACVPIVRGQYLTMLNYTDKAIQDSLEELHKARLIVLYRIDGDQYAEFTRFQDFQSLNPNREAKSTIPQPTPEDSGVTPEDSMLSKDKLSKDKIRQSNTDCAFESFWMKYPKKVGKGAALSAFNKIKPNQELLAKMLIAIDQQKSSTQWKNENGRYIPNPATWLNQGRWDDVVETPTTKTEHRRCRLCNRILNSGERQDGVCLQCKFKEKQTA